MEFVETRVAGEAWSGGNFLMTCMKPLERVSAEAELLGASNLLSFRMALILKLA